MSRIVDKPAAVVTRPGGSPALVNGSEVLHVHETYRTWAGVLEGRPEIDIWWIETPGGVLELHNEVNTTKWTIARQAD